MFKRAQAWIRWIQGLGEPHTEGCRLTPGIPSSLLSLWNPKIYSMVSENWGTVWRGEGKFQLSACSWARNLCLLSKSVFPWLSSTWPRHSGPHPFSPHEVCFTGLGSILFNPLGYIRSGCLPLCGKEAQRDYAAC